MQLLRTQGNDVVSWSKNGDVKIHGKRLRGTNIVDLVGDVVRTTPSKTNTPERDYFLNALAEVNIPETLVKNKTALERYRLKKTDTNRVTEVEKEENDEKNINNDNASSSSAQKVEKPVRKKQKQAGHTNIDWNAPL